MKFQLDSAIEILERTPGVLRAMLAGLGEPWVMSNYGTDTFSPFDVVGHLIQGERADLRKSQLVDKPICRGIRGR